jgi:hypothetical protein
MSNGVFKYSFLSAFVQDKIMLSQGDQCSKVLFSKSQRRLLTYIAIVFMCVMPPLCSWLIFKFQLFGFFSVRYHGMLMTPPVKIQALPFVNEAPYATKQKWLIWYVVPGDCTQYCQHKIVDISRLHLALGDAMLRVDSGLSELSEVEAFDITTLEHGRYAAFKHWILQRDAFNKLTEKNSQLTPSPNGDIYLVDPVGNIFMKYPFDTNPDLIFKDIKRVLYASHLG